MSILCVLLIVFAVVLFILAGALNPPPDSPWKNRLVCFGLACLAGADLVRSVPLLK